MSIFDSTQQSIAFSDVIPELSPSLRWAQSKSHTFIELKYATRFDSPACLDLFDEKLEIKNNKTLSLSAMCRNDQKLLRYSLDIDLFDDVHPFEITEDRLLDYTKEYNKWSEADSEYQKKFKEWEAQKEEWEKKLGKEKEVDDEGEFNDEDKMSDEENKMNEED